MYAERSVRERCSGGLHQQRNGNDRQSCGILLNRSENNVDMQSILQIGKIIERSLG